MIVRLVITAVVLLGVAVASRAYRRWREKLSHPVTVPPLSAELIDGAERTWVVFTTPFCAQCGPVMERIGSVDPGARIVTVDVADRPDLADRFAVRTAPTVLLAGADGFVRARLVGNVPAAALSASLV
jgi:hypothetical protein